MGMQMIKIMVFIIFFGVRRIMRTKGLVNLIINLDVVFVPCLTRLCAANEAIAYGFAPFN